MVAAAAACDARPSGPWALKPRTSVTLEVTTREDLIETGAARRLEISLRGAVGDDGAMALEVERVLLEVRDKSGEVVRTVTPRPAGDEGPGPSPALEALRGAAVRVGLDPAAGVTGVTGIDRAFEVAEAEIGKEGEAIALLASDAAWTHDLANAGMSALPESLRPGAALKRTARVLLVGRTETLLQLAGEAARDDRGSPAVHLAGGIASDSTNSPDLTCEATTSYAGEQALPFRGEFTVTTPFAAGLTLRRTTSFKLVLR